MDKLLEIKREIEEKKGRVWLGIVSKAEKILNDLSRYLDHPKLHEDLTLAEEIIKLYEYAKETNFTRMEGIIRKLDQLSIKIGIVPAEIEKKKLEATDSTLHEKEPVCKNCDNVNRITAKFCDNCGAKL
ncbi:MAG: hypothetical protein ACFE8A_07850 [Candidatus Hodarchaeota archaeon]